MSLMEEVQHLRIPLEKIKLATKNFSEETFIAQGGFGKVYVGILTLTEQQIKVAVKRLDCKFGQGNREYLTEIQMLTCYKHKNLVSLIGFCDDDGESILVYEHAEHGSLDKHLSNTIELSWIQRVKISLGAARGLSYLHDDVGPNHRVLHRDIKSSNILLDENWEAKISDFGLSKLGPSNVEFTFLVTTACGTHGYIDPQYHKTGILTKESDIYSFGVVLFEILCGRLAHMCEYEDERVFLATLAPKLYEKNKLDEIIDPILKNQMNEDSLKMFSEVAYQCLKKKREDRPTMGEIIEQLEQALQLQVCNYPPAFIRVGTWGKQSVSPDNDQWSISLEPHHKLQKISIDHGDVIYSLMFTTQCGGVFHISNKAGGSASGKIVTGVLLDADEEIICIKGTIGTRCGITTISSLTFETNKRTHGPFGRATKCVFSLPWEKGSLVGFYGLAGDFIESIGVYLKADHQVMKFGIWGAPYTTIPWSIKLEKNHHLKEIIIGHNDDNIVFLVFTTQYKGLKNIHPKAGGVNAKNQEKVIMDWDEEIIGITGTTGLSKAPHIYLVILSISFVTNKKTHGPFGSERGTPFDIQWNSGSFAGFYGAYGGYLDSIGVYLKNPVVRI